MDFFVQYLLFILVVKHGNCSDWNKSEILYQILDENSHWIQASSAMMGESETISKNYCAVLSVLKHRSKEIISMYNIYDTDKHHRVLRNMSLYQRWTIYDNMTYNLHEKFINTQRKPYCNHDIKLYNKLRFYKSGNFITRRDF